jgi:Tfp pilus assembly protein PilN
VRPVNLIPAEERRGTDGAMRSGPLPYIVLGALLLALAAVTVLVVTNNQISSRETELAKAKVQTETAEQTAQRLAPFVTFHTVSEARKSTISNLANSRFDWQKVLKQLALLLPEDVRLSNLTGTVRPEVSVGNGENVAMRSAILGPALSMAGCAESQKGVAEFVSVLKDIDGVTRVGLQSSVQGGGEGESVSASSECGDNLDTQFQLVVAFDAAPIPAIGSGGEAVAPPEEEAAPESTEGGEGEEAPAPEGESE